MASTVAISGASGKTGYRIAEEVQRRGDQARLLLRATSQPPDSLQGVDQWRLSLMDATALDAALEGVDALVTVSYTHLRAHETRGNLVCRLLLEKKKK